MFSWRTTHNLDPYFRALYIMQLIAIGSMLAGMGLTWWQGEDAHNVFNLLNRSIDDLKHRDPNVLGQPLVVLWFLWPAVIISGLRSFTGVLVQPVAFRRLAVVGWVVAMLALGHFYINFGDEIPDHSPLKDGSIEAGFWLTGSSTLFLGLLTLAEFVIRPPFEDPFAKPDGTAAVDDAERLWRGDYQTCPYCGMLNEPGARSCYNCKNLLFDFSGDEP